MKSSNLKYPYIVLAQAKIESGNYTSVIFKENNNLFGMKLARLRPTTLIGENKGHAVYTTWKESVYDYCLYQSSFNFKTEDEYYHILYNYAQDSTYVNYIKDIVNKEKLKLKFENYDR